MLDALDFGGAIKVVAGKSVSTFSMKNEAPMDVYDIYTGCFNNFV